MCQAEDRTHRIGQRDSVLVQHIVFDGSLDSHLAKTLIAKQEIIDQALDAETNVDVAGEDIEFKPEDIKPVSDKRRALDEVAAKLSADQIEAIHSALRVVASMDSDHAQFRNDVGFNGADTMFGCQMAAQERLSPRQAAACFKLIRKYKRQYDDALFARIFN
jgi:hypothetical protein